MSEFPAELVEAARVSKAWPFEEARKLIARTKRPGFDGEVLFETGYGPSGLPHIGTFGEVARTAMVRHAFRVLDRRYGEDAARLLLRRHGWSAENPRQRAEPGHAEGVPRHGR